RHRAHAVPHHRQPPAALRRAHAPAARAARARCHQGLRPRGVGAARGAQEPRRRRRARRRAACACRSPRAPSSRAGAVPARGDPDARQAAEQVHAKERKTRALERALREELEATAGAPGNRRLENLTTLLAQTKSEYLAQAQAFLARYPQYKAQFVDQQTVDPKALAKFADRLPADTLAIQYFPAPDMLYLFVVAPGGSFQVRSRAITQDDLYPLVREYRRLLDAATTEHLPWVNDGSAAYRDKVAPLREVSRTP